MKVSMKRICSTVFICIAILVLLVYPSASASNAVETNAASPTPTAAGSQKSAIEIRNNIPNQWIDTHPIPEEEILPSPTPIVKYHYNVPPLNPKTDDFNVPAMDKIADWLTRTNLYMIAKQIREKVIPHQPDNLFISGRTKRCVYIDGVLVDEKKGYYETEFLTYLPPLDTAGQLLSSHLVRNAVSLTNGSYDFTGPAYRIDDTEMECDLTGPGTTQLPPKTVKLVAGSWFTELLQWIKDELLDFRIVYVSKQQTPEGERIHCLLNGCVKETFTPDYNLDYIQDAKTKERTKQSGGVADAGFRAVFMDTTKSKSAHGQEENFTETNTVKTKQMENSADLIKCSLVPPAQRAVLGLTTENCSDFVTNLPTTTSCGTTLPDLTVSDTACTLCNTSSINSYTDDNSFPTGDIPPTMKAIIEKAGETFNVPPSLLIGIMYTEGAFTNNRFEWTEENVKNWSFCGQEMPNCDKTQDSKAQFPFGWIPYWFYKGDGSGAVWNAVQKIDPSRNRKDLVSPCNFLDGIFALARAMNMWYGVRNPDVVKHNVFECSGYKLIDNTLPSSCNWDEARAAQARIGFAGYCPDPGKHTVVSYMPDDDKFIPRAVNRWKAFKCY